MNDAKATHVDSVLHVLQTAETHLASEYVDDLEATVGSVTKTPTYAFMPEPGRITVITDPAGVRQFYVDARSQFEPAASRLITHITSDWYEFQENVPTRRLVETDELVTLNTVNIFPAADDGIQGEFLWERYAAESEERLETPPEIGAQGELPLRQLRNARAHEAFLGRLRSGSLDAIVGSVAEDCLWAIRSYQPDSEDRPLLTAEGPSEVRALFAAWMSAFEVVHLSVLTRHAAEWYVFAEELYTVRCKVGEHAGELREFRKASVYSIGSGGTILGEIGYGTPLGEPSSRSGREVGAISWVNEATFRDELLLIDP